ncbi:hypothetical protein QTP86_012817 [Hemibagrus guttatus]|nr:hypothetical protein QTP86_012817 [Hemibagrus guttatus]
MMMMMRRRRRRRRMTQDNTPDCMASIMVPRNTVWKARAMDSLKINCTIDSDPHCWNKINITWCRIEYTKHCKHLNHPYHKLVEWTSINESKRLLFLIFRNISMQDAGLYRYYVPDCSTASNNVESQANITTNTWNTAANNPGQPPSYVYICGGIGGLIFIVVVSVIVVQCRGKKKSIKKTIHENQSTATPVADIAPPIYPREFPHKSQTLPAQVSPPQSCTYDTPPVRVRVTSLRDRSSAGRHPVSRGPPRRCHDRQEVEDVEEVEEENPLIYATLNHEAAPQRPVRVTHVQIEESEYAAIKVT